MTALHDHTARELRDSLTRGDLTPTELVQHYLERIDRLNHRLGAFITVTPESALQRAEELEATGRGHGVGESPLWGLPFADKDLVARAGVRTTYGSRAFAQFVPETSDAFAVALDATGAVSLGKTNTPEFGMPAHTENLLTGPARNPWNLELGSGGSSGGAATAVAAGLLPLAPGSDGGGSVRIPASATGLVGIKPSRGLIPSGTGIDSLGGLAVPGPLARTVADAAMLLDAVLRGEQPFTLRAPRPWAGSLEQAALTTSIESMTIAIVTSTPWDSRVNIELEPQALEALDVAARELETHGHTLRRLQPEWPSTYAEHFTTVWQAGAAAIPIGSAQEALLEPLTRWLLENGRRRSAPHLAAALRGFTDFERSIIGQFAEFDAVLTPALAQSPRPIGWYSHEPERNFEQQVQFTPFTSFVNVAGLPAVTVPIIDADELPVAVQLIGRPGGEETLIGLAAQLESSFLRGDRHPPIWYD